MADLTAWFGRRGIYYGWVIVAVMFVTLFVSNGFRFAFGVYYSAILDETGFLEADNEFLVQPRVEIRPRPDYSMRGRVYAAAMSPDAKPRAS